MKLLDLSKCKTNKEVSDKIMARVRSVSLADLTKALSTDFIFQDGAIRNVYIALATNNNAILWGPGGFGKSVLVKAICKELGIPVICKLGYDGMTPEELLGIPNMGKLLNDSKLETAFENSVFAQPGILLLEEFFDVDPSTAASLKDVMTERGFREGSSKKESLIATVILTGNKNPEDLAVDFTTKAFYFERFAHHYHMVWDSFTEKRYLAFFKIYYKELFKLNKSGLTLVAKLCESAPEAISPRVATQAGDVAINMGVEYLDTVRALDTTMIAEMQDLVDKQAMFLSETELLERVHAKVKDVMSLLESADLYKLVKWGYFIGLISHGLGEKEFLDENVKELNDIKALIRHGLERIQTRMNEHVELDTLTEAAHILLNDKEIQ